MKAVLNSEHLGKKYKKRLKNKQKKEISVTQKYKSSWVV